MHPSWCENQAEEYERASPGAASSLDFGDTARFCSDVEWRSTRVHPVSIELSEEYESASIKLVAHVAPECIRSAVKGGRRSTRAQCAGQTAQQVASAIIESVENLPGRAVSRCSG